MKGITCVFVGILVITTGLLIAAPRVFQAKDGGELIATITAVTGDDVHLKRPDGKAVVIPIDRFIATDVAFIKKWAEENKGKVPEHLKNVKPRLSINVSTGKTNKKDDNFSGYIDERKQKLAFKVTLENEDAKYPIDDANVSLLVMGRSPETRKDAVVYKEVFENVSLPYNTTRTLEAEPFELWYDDEGAMYGHKYKGYMVIVQDPGGKVLGEVVIPSAARKYLDAILELEAGDVYSSKYVKEDSVSLTKSVRK